MRWFYVYWIILVFCVDNIGAKELISTKVIEGVGKFSLIPNLWKVRNIQATCEPGVKKMQVFWGNSAAEAEEKVENSRDVKFCGWNSLLEGDENNCLFQVSPFEDGIVEIAGQEDWFAGQGTFCQIEDKLVLAPEKFFLGFIGFLLFWFAPVLIESQVFRISIGSSIIVTGSVILLAYFLARAMPGKKIGIGLAVLGGFTYTIFRFLLYWTLDSFVSLMENPLFIGYVIISGLLGAAVTYYFDRPEDVKLNRIFRSALQLFALFLLYHSTSWRIASLLLCGIVILMKIWAPSVELPDLKKLFTSWEGILQEEEEREDSQIQSLQHQAEQEVGGLDYLCPQRAPYISPPGWKPHNMKIREQKAEPPIQKLPYKRPSATQLQPEGVVRSELGNNSWYQSEDTFKTPFSFRRKDGRQTTTYGNNLSQEYQQQPILLQQNVQNLNEGGAQSQDFPMKENSVGEQELFTPILPASSHGAQMSPSGSSIRVRREKLHFGEASGLVQGVEVTNQNQAHNFNQAIENLRFSGTSPMTTPIRNIRTSGFGENQQDMSPNVDNLQQQPSSSRRSRQTRSHGVSAMSASPSGSKYKNMDSGRGINKDGPTYNKLIGQGYVVDHVNKTIRHP